jgi:hypothetical protein
MPNPATGKVKIRFDMPSGSFLTISLSTLLGTETRQPVQGYFPAGTHEVPLDVSTLDRGVYILSLSTEKATLVTKLILR